MKKIEYAVGAARIFISHLHLEDFDRGMIATFGNNFRIEQSFTSTESRLHAALTKIERNIKGERTRLYDSIEDIISEFWRNGVRDRPWLLTIVTDGQDTGSLKYKSNPAAIGRYVAQHYNQEESNFIFVIGVGEGRQIDESALGTLSDNGGFLAVRIEAFPLLEMAFLDIAVTVSTQLAGQVTQVGNRSWEEVAEIREVARIPMDYAFLIDCSGSMKETG